MAKWIIQVDEGNGWEECDWTPQFDTEEEAWDFIYGDDYGDGWGRQVRAIQLDGEDDY